MTNKKSNILFFLLFIFGFTTHAATISKTLYINRGEFSTVSHVKFPYFAFNNNTQYKSQNEIIQISTTDILILKIINNDSVLHGFNIKRYTDLNATINPKDSIIDTLTFTTQGIFIYYDSYQYPKYRYMGAAGMITVLNSTTDKKFYWNLKEHQSTYNQLLGENKKVDWSAYTPDYFTINGFSFPDVLNDTLSWVNGKIGDTIHIFIANTGQSAHAIHIHGFHGKTIFSSVSGEINWEKDTFPIRSMEAIILELIPDKPGFYSIHDHNLLAITAGGIYQRGMLTLMNFIK
jgi:hypothetical protein